MNTYSVVSGLAIPIILLLFVGAVFGFAWLARRKSIAGGCLGAFCVLGLILVLLMFVIFPPLS